jgi:hypothetical protein
LPGKINFILLNFENAWYTAEGYLWNFRLSLSSYRERWRSVSLYRRLSQKFKCPYHIVCSVGIFHGRPGVLLIKGLPCLLIKSAGEFCQSLGTLVARLLIKVIRLSHSKIYFDQMSMKI